MACDYLLAYPKIEEADTLRLAPTVSSTLTLVLGDAIACELSARKNFTREDFYKFHPNGALGEMLKKERN
jgi:D-arabinose 5-phosphate isomerase GutQ